MESGNLKQVLITLGEQISTKIKNGNPRQSFQEKE